MRRTPSSGILVSAACLLFASVGHATPQVTTVKGEGKASIKVQNPDLCAVTITIEATLENMACNKPLPHTVEVAPGATVEVCAFSRSDSGKAWKYDYKWKSQIGSAKAQHDENAVYRFPYPAGVTYPVMQGHLGTFSHTGQYSYALDWKMPIGSKVCAARAGRVVKTKADSDQGGPAEEFRKLANSVSILHADGTIGEYVHLKKDGILVKVGDEVQAGDAVALSGNTGYSSAPHLHFHVFIPVDGTQFQTIPVKFRAAAGAILPRQGKSYEAL